MGLRPARSPHGWPTVSSALDLDTGGGEVMAEMPQFPPRMCVTEGWPPNVREPASLLGPRGVEVVEVGEGGAAALSPTRPSSW